MKVKNIEIPLKRIHEFCNRWQVIEFALFGSVLRQDFRPDSDIDIMVRFNINARPIFSGLEDLEKS